MDIFRFPNPLPHHPLVTWEVGSDMLSQGGVYLLQQTHRVAACTLHTPMTLSVHQTQNWTRLTGPILQSLTQERAAERVRACCRRIRDTLLTHFMSHHTSLVSVLSPAVVPLIRPELDVLVLYIYQHRLDSGLQNLLAAVESFRLLTPSELPDLVTREILTPEQLQQLNPVTRRPPLRYGRLPFSSFSSSASLPTSSSVIVSPDPIESPDPTPPPVREDVIDSWERQLEGLLQFSDERVVQGDPSPGL